MTEVTMSFVWLAVFGCAEDPDRLELCDEHVYRFEEYPVPGRLTVAPGSDVCVDWSGLTRTARGDPYAPTVDDELRLVGWAATADEIDSGATTSGDVVESELARDLQRQRAFCLDQLLRRYPLALEAGTTWLVELETGSGRDADQMPVSAALVEVVEGADTAEVLLTDELTGITFDVELGVAIEAPAAVPDVVLDWSGLYRGGDVHDATDGWKGQVDGVFAARFEVPEPGDLPAVLDARLGAAVERYDLPTGPVGAVSLASAVDSDGNSFPGFSGDGVWVVGVTCDYCWITAPPIVTVVAVGGR